MTYEKNPDMSGVLFKNEKKQSEKSPDYTGHGIVKNQQVYISAWVNEAKGGRKYFALKFKEKDANKPRETKSGSGEFDDTIPFARFEDYIGC